MTKKTQSGKSKQIAEIKISDKKQILVSIELYKAKKYLAIREQYKEDEEDEDWKYGKQGLNIPVSALSEKKLAKLIKALEEASEKLFSEDEDEEEDEEEDEKSSKKKKKKSKKDEDEDEDDEDEDEDEDEKSSKKKKKSKKKDDDEDEAEDADDDFDDDD